jgi:hypothetical protein
MPNNNRGTNEAVAIPSPPQEERASLPAEVLLTKAGERRPIPSAAQARVAAVPDSSFDIWNSDFIRHLAFVIRH